MATITSLILTVSTFFGISITPATATSTPDLITCVNLASRAERISLSGSCGTKEAKAYWHSSTSYSKTLPFGSVKQITICSNKGLASKQYQVIRTRCGSYQSRSDYFRLKLAPEPPVIEKVIAKGSSSAEITFSNSFNSNPDAPISYYVVAPNNDRPFSISRWTGSTLAINNLLSNTKYSFKIKAVTADGTSSYSLDSREVITSQAIAVKTLITATLPAVTVNLNGTDSASVTVPIGATDFSINATGLGNLKMSFPTQTSESTGSIGAALNPAGSGATPFSAVAIPTIIDISLPGLSETSTICLTGGSDSRLWHYFNGAWSDITTSHMSGQVCGISTTLGIFASAPMPIPPVFSLSAAAESKTVSSGSISGYSISSSGGAIASFAISPAISNTPGLIFDTSTGLISGTPTQVANARNYTITATNADGSSTSTFTITVLPVAPAFTLSTTSETKISGSAISGYSISSTGGTIASYSISPAINNTPGLSFDPTTGLISGTPTQVAPPRTYTVTGINAGGSASATFTIRVNPIAPAFTFSSTSETQTVSAGSIVGYTISSTGGAISTFAINPDISNTPGLTFDSTTGVISGTPTQIATARTYTITGSNDTGDATRTFTITVLPTAPSFTLSSSAETQTVSAGAITGYSISSTGGEIATYAISPAISNTPGLSFNTATGLISGTPSQVASARTYTVTGINAGGSTSRTFTITVLPVVPSFTLSSNSESKISGVSLLGYTITSSGGLIASYSISPAITNTPGLSFSTSTGLITGTPTQAATERIYTITGTNAGGSSSATFAITVLPVAPAFTFSSTSETKTVGVALAGYTISTTGGAASSYSISPAISNTPGLSFNTSTGLISGTPTQIATVNTYTVTGTNLSGSASATFTITVLPVAPAFTFSSASETKTVSSGAITGYTINSTGGTIASFAISPDIGNTPGLTFNTSTGLISGAPTQIATARTYTVTGTNAGGSSSRTFTITVVPVVPAFTLSSSSETKTSGTAITGYTITSTGGTIASYSISPAITNTPGLAFSTSTGLISGTPSASASAYTYTITATNAGGSTSQAFTITVTEPVYAVGDTGPGGGKVFYVSVSAFTMTGAPCGTNCHYLEWAPSSWAASDYSANQFGGSSAFYGGGTGSALGTGYSNTVLLATANAGTGYTVLNADVPVYVRAYRGGGKSDWFLPSWDETLLISNSSIYSSGGFASNYYWSSTANSTGPGTSVQLHDITSKTKNDPGLQPIYRNFPVRPIRAG